MPSSKKYVPKTPRPKKSNCSSSESSKEKELDTVNVFCRLKGLKNSRETCIKLISTNVLSTSYPTESKALQEDSQYSFKHIFTSCATQKEVFEHVALPLLHDVLQGKNGLLFTYGVAGSGKTYTLIGEPLNSGIIPKCIDTIFNSLGEFQTPRFIIKSNQMNGFQVQTQSDALKDQRLENKSNSCSLEKKSSGDSRNLFSNDGNKILGINETNLYAVFVSYVEIYNNTVFDLLDESGGKELQSKVLREDFHKNIFVNGVIEVEVKSSGEAFKVFSLGQKRKHNKRNIVPKSESSRSHSIFNIRIVQWVQEGNNSSKERVVSDKNLLKIGELSLVDLAWSEHSPQTQITGMMQFKEASLINNSLITLHSCLETLRDNQLNKSNRLVPYRDCRLTLLFKRYFEGEGKIHMMLCLNSDVNNYKENFHTLKFAVLSQDSKIIKTKLRGTPSKKPQFPKPPCCTPRSKVKNVHTLIQEIPPINLTFDNCEEDLAQIDSLAKALLSRKQKAETSRKECDQILNNFRRKVIDTTYENILKTVELKSVFQQYKNEQKKTCQMELNILEFEKEVAILESEKKQLKDAIRSIHCDLNEKDRKLKQNLLEFERQKQKMELLQEKNNKKLVYKLKKQRRHLNAAMEEKDKKIKKVREILDDIPSDYCTEKSRFEAEIQLTYPKTSTPKNLVRTPKERRNNIVNANRHRSRSVEENCLKHNLVKPIPLRTVIKRRKSITQLTIASNITNKKQSKFCIIAQEAKIDDEVETMVYNQDIVPTSGEGQVIFNDLEGIYVKRV